MKTSASLKQKLSASKYTRMLEHTHIQHTLTHTNTHTHRHTHMHTQMYHHLKPIYLSCTTFCVFSTSFNSILIFFNFSLSNDLLNSISILIIISILFSLFLYFYFFFQTYEIRLPIPGQLHIRIYCYLLIFVRNLCYANVSIYYFIFLILLH
jgi:hypothetical protein